MLKSDVLQGNGYSWAFSGASTAVLLTPTKTNIDR